MAEEGSTLSIEPAYIRGATILPEVPCTLAHIDKVAHSAADSDALLAGPSVSSCIHPHHAANGGNHVDDDRLDRSLVGQLGQHPLEGANDAVEVALGVFETALKESDGF